MKSINKMKQEAMEKIQKRVEAQVAYLKITEIEHAEDADVKPLIVARETASAKQKELSQKYQEESRAIQKELSDAVQALGEALTPFLPKDIFEN